MILLHNQRSIRRLAGSPVLSVGSSEALPGLHSPATGGLRAPLELERADFTEKNGMYRPPKWCLKPEIRGFHGIDPAIYDG